MTDLEKLTEPSFVRRRKRLFEQTISNSPTWVDPDGDYFDKYERAREAKEEAQRQWDMFIGRAA